MTESSIPITLEELRAAMEFMTKVRDIYRVQIPQLPKTIRDDYPPKHAAVKARWGESLVGHYLDQNGTIVEVKGGRDNPDIVDVNHNKTEVKSFSTDAGWNRLQGQDVTAEKLYAVDWRPILCGKPHAEITKVGQDDLTEGRIDLEELNATDVTRFNLFGTRR